MPRNIAHTQELSILSFENRSEGEKKEALSRVAHNALEGDRTSGSATTELMRDVRLITNTPARRILGQRAMLAPYFSHIFQSRGSHTQMVSEVGQNIAHKLKLGAASSELVKGICEAHDMGHLPFSHEGEQAVNEIVKPLGVTFDHDKAVLAVLLRDTIHGINYDGLPLTATMVEGIAKRYCHGEEEQKFPAEFSALAKKHNLHIGKYNHVEGQVASSADWIAGTVSDIQDMINFHMASDNPEKNVKQFFEELRKAFPLAREVYDELVKDMGKADWDERRQWKGGKEQRLIALTTQFCERLKERLEDDVVDNANKLLQKYDSQITHAEDVRNLPEMIVTLSPDVEKQLNDLKIFYSQKIYPELFEKYCDGKDLVKRMFQDLFTGTVEMSDGWKTKFDEIGSTKRAVSAEQKQKEKAQLVISYMTANVTDYDVIQHIQKHHPDLAATIPDIRQPTASMKLPYFQSGVLGDTVQYTKGKSIP